MALPAGSRMVPIARPLPSGFGTLVETRTYSTPLVTKNVAVIPLPSSLLTASTMSKLLLILVEPKYRAGASLPPTASFPSSLGAPNFPAMAFKLAIEFATRGSACAFPVLGIRLHDARAHAQPAARIPTRKLFLFISRLLLREAGVLATPWLINEVEVARVHLAQWRFKRR